MRRKLFVLTLIIASAFVFYLPAQARDSKTANRIVAGKTALQAVAEVRFVRVRGRRYKVWYRTFRRGGRKYVRIYRIQYA
jgi:hypothetical protein